MSVKHRTEQRLLAIDRNKADLARELGTEAQNVNNWMARDSIPAKYLNAAAKYLQCDAEWLRAGIGDAKGTGTERGLPAGKYEFIPYYNIKLAAGDGYDNGDHIVQEQGAEYYSEVKDLAFRRSWLAEQGLSHNELAVVEIAGESMMPRLHDGDMVLVKTTEIEITNGKVYAMSYGNDLKVKRLERRYDGALIIKSDNQSPEYTDEVVPAQDLEHIKIIGRVVKLVSGGGF